MLSARKNHGSLSTASLISASFLSCVSPRLHSRRPHDAVKRRRHSSSSTTNRRPSRQTTPHATLNAIIVQSCVACSRFGGVTVEITLRETAPAHPPHKCTYVCTNIQRRRTQQGAAANIHVQRKLLPRSKSRVLTHIYLHL